VGDDEVIGAFGVARESSTRESRGSWVGLGWVGPGLGEWRREVIYHVY
jgi:hypothetical protein